VRAAVFLLAWAAGAACGGAEYRYPQGLPAKSLKMEVKEEPLGRIGEDRHMRVLRVEIPGKQLKDTRPIEGVTLHVRQVDGSDLQLAANAGMSYSYSGGGWALKLTTNVVLSWTPSLPGAKEDETYPCYIAFEAGPKKWATREFSLKIGGSGRHMHCDKCFSIGMAPKAGWAATAATRLGATAGGSGAGEAPWAVSVRGARVQDLLGGDEIAGRDVTVDEDVLIYSLDALPREEGMGRLKAGLTVHVIGEAAPSLAHVTFTTSSGRTYEGAAKISDLVPEHDLGVDVSVPSMSETPDPHRNNWKLLNIPFSLVPQGTAASTVRLRCMGTDGTSKDLPVQGAVASSATYSYVNGTLALDARPGDEFLCFAVFDDGKKTWTSQAFGLACGPGPHGECAECFDFVPQAQVGALLEKVLEAKKAAVRRTPADAGEPSGAAFRPGKTVLRRDTPIYSLRALPHEQALGTLKAGAVLYVMEDLGGAYVRVRFTTPGGRSGEGAAKKAGLGTGAEAR